MMLRLLVSPALLLFLAPASIYARQTEMATPSSDGADLVLRALDGRERSLRDYRGQIVVLNFWATWCVPCLKEIPVLVSMHKRYERHGVQIIGASADQQTTQGRVSRFVRRRKINFAVWVGATSVDMKRLGLGEALPATAIIDRDGQILWRVIGILDEEDLRDRIEWLLGDRRSPPPPPISMTDGHARGQEDHDESGPSHKHESGEGHEHGSVGIEGASTVPS